MTALHFNFNDFSVAFLSILFEGVPFMLLGTLLSGLVDAFVPPGAMERLVAGRSSVGIGVSALLGIVFPMCECGVVPVIRRLMLKGMPVSCALTYLLAAPIVNPVVAFSTYVAFRSQNPLWIVGARLLGGFVVAVGVGLIIARMKKETILNDDMLHAMEDRRLANELSKSMATEPLPFSTKLTGALRCTGHDFVDVTCYLVIGAALAAFFNTAVNRDVIAPFASNVFAATPVMMVLAFTLSLCSTSDAFVAANFVAFPMAAKLAFMIFGPMMDLKLVFMYGLVFRYRFTILLALGLFVAISVLCVLTGGFVR